MKIEDVKAVEKLEDGMKKAAEYGEKLHRNTRALRTLFHTMVSTVSGPFAQAAHQIELMHRAGNDAQSTMYGTVNLASQLVKFISESVVENRKQVIAATDYQRVMGGTLDHMRSLQREQSHWDKLLGAQEGWSDGLLDDFKKLNLDSRTSTRLLEKFHQAAAPENLGSSTQQLAKAFVNVNREAAKMQMHGQKYMATRMQILDLAGDDIYLAQKMNDELRKSGKAYFDIKETNEIIYRTMNDNQNKVIDPTTVVPKWDQAKDYIQKSISQLVAWGQEKFGGLIMDFKKEIEDAQKADPRERKTRADFMRYTLMTGGFSASGYADYVAAQIQQQPKVYVNHANKGNGPTLKDRMRALGFLDTTTDPVTESRIREDELSEPKGQTKARESLDAIGARYHIEAIKNGEATMDGLEEGILNKDPYGLGAKVLKLFSDGFTDTADINSPSGLFADHGTNIVAGAVQGVQAETPKLHQAIAASIPDLRPGSGGGLSIGSVNFGSTNIQTNSEASGEQLGENYGAAHAMMLIHSLETASRQMGVRR